MEAITKGKSLFIHAREPGGYWEEVTDFFKKYVYSASVLGIAEGRYEDWTCSVYNFVCACVYACIS